MRQPWKRKPCARMVKLENGVWYLKTMESLNCLGFFHTKEKVSCVYDTLIWVFFNMNPDLILIDANLNVHNEENSLKFGYICTMEYYPAPTKSEINPYVVL